MRLVPENRRGLEKIVNSNKMNINETLDALIEEMKNYGFSGSIELKLVIKLDDEGRGEEYATIDDSIKLNFQRR